MRVLFVIVVLAASIVVAPVAQATFPGGNGRIARVIEQNGNGDIVLTQPTENVTSSPTVDDRSPAWKKTVDQIAFASNLGGGDYEIYRAPPFESAPPTPLTNNTVDDLQPSWSPDGTQLVMVRETGASTTLMILATDGSGTATPLTPAGVSGAVDPNWSPDGTRIAFAAFEPGVSQRDIFTVSPNGTGLDNVTNTPFIDDREPNWAPGNARIAYSSFLNSNWDIHVINAGGTGDTNITNYPGANDRDPAWSPDATRIVFTTRREFERDSLINIASTGVFPVQAGDGTAPDWGVGACSDGIDNDGDGQTDYPNDPGCFSQQDPDERNPQCNDDFDNDGDGDIDLADPGCVSSSDDSEAPNPLCADGVDNDGDGLTDYPDDPGCVSETDESEFNPPPPDCSDGIDNDGDSQTDYPNDPGCASTSDDDETNPACNDGLDNDFDNRIDFPADPGCSSAADNDESNATGSGTFVRPKSAPRIRVPLVPAFNACASPNRTHGPPLAFPSCDPPVHSSNAVTVGTPENNGAADNSEGSVTLTVDPGVPGLPEDSDVILMAEITDVRCKAGTTSCGNSNATDGTDYTGQLQGTAPIRITDRFNAVSAGGGADAATVVDIPFPLNMACTNTASTAVGGLCTANTTFNSIVPNAFRDGKRSVLDVGQIVINDGGPDGNVATAPNTRFMAQGVFVP